MIQSDYQTPRRMRQKLQALPIPADLTGQRVLDVGCDFGAFCKLASDRGAVDVLGLDRGRLVRAVPGSHAPRGFVNLAQHNAAQGWPNCRFLEVVVGEEWPVVGKFDLVLACSIYHHLFVTSGANHHAIWQWLASCVAPTGQLIWEGPVDMQDDVAATRAREVGAPYHRADIWAAATHVFGSVVYHGPALHRPHREVWVCRAPA